MKKKLKTVARTDHIVSSPFRYGFITATMGCQSSKALHEDNEKLGFVRFESGLYRTRRQNVYQPGCDTFVGKLVAKDVKSPTQFSFIGKPYYYESYIVSSLIGFVFLKLRAIAIGK